jgi:hypothetical protein
VSDRTDSATPCAVHGRPARIAEGRISTFPRFLTLKLRHFSARREASTLLGGPEGPEPALGRWSKSGQIQVKLKLKLTKNHVSANVSPIVSRPSPTQRTRA